MSSKRVFSIIIFLLLLLLVAHSIAQTSDLKWHKKLKKKVDQAIRVSQQNPLEALLIFKNILEGKEVKKPKRKQIPWLWQQISSLQPKALAVLQKDFDIAEENLDLRGMTLASAVANQITKDAIKSEPAISEAKKKLLAEAAVPGDIWKITDVTATFLEGSYSVLGEIGVTITPKPKGNQLIRVKAKVENISDESDKEYTLWALGNLKRIMGSFNASEEVHRWLDDSFIYVVTPDSAFIPCVHVCGGCLLKLSVRISADKLVFTPRAIEKGESMDLDLLFSVPKGIKDYMLFILGSAPTQVKTFN